MAILFAATYPERTRALVLYGAYAKRLDPDDDYPWAPTREARAAYIEALERDWGFESDMKQMCPSADDAMARWWGERCRAAASPGAVRALDRDELADRRPRAAAGDPRPHARRPPRHRLRRARRGGSLHRRAHPAAPASSSCRAPTTSSASTRIRSSTSSSRSWPNAAPPAEPCGPTIACWSRSSRPRSSARAAFPDHRRARAGPPSRPRARGRRAIGSSRSFDGPASAVRCATAITDAAGALGDRRPHRRAHGRGRDRRRPRPRPRRRRRRRRRRRGRARRGARVADRHRPRRRLRARVRRPRAPGARRRPRRTAPAGRRPSRSRRADAGRRTAGRACRGARAPRARAAAGSVGNRVDGAGRGRGGDRQDTAGERARGARRAAPGSRRSSGAASISSAPSCPTSRSSRRCARVRRELPFVEGRSAGSQLRRVRGDARAARRAPARRCCWCSRTCTGPTRRRSTSSPTSRTTSTSGACCCS